MYLYLLTMYMYLKYYYHFLLSTSLTTICLCSSDLSKCEWNPVLWPFKCLNLLGSTATWSHYFPIFFKSVFWISYHFEFFHFTVAGIRDYDNALATSGAFGNSNGIAGQTASLPFAAGPCYEDPEKVAFYENPLAAPKVPQRNDSLEEHPGDPKDSSLYDNPNSPMDGSGACTIC